jgi:hypothetical protein
MYGFAMSSPCFVFQTERRSDNRRAVGLVLLPSGLARTPPAPDNRKLAGIQRRGIRVIETSKDKIWSPTLIITRLASICLAAFEALLPISTSQI